MFEEGRGENCVYCTEFSVLVNHLELEVGGILGGPTLILFLYLFNLRDLRTKKGRISSVHGF